MILARSRAQPKGASHDVMNASCTVWTEPPAVPACRRCVSWAYVRCCLPPTYKLGSDLSSWMPASGVGTFGEEIKLGIEGIVLAFVVTTVSAVEVCHAALS